MFTYNDASIVVAAKFVIIKLRQRRRKFVNNSGSFRENARLPKFVPKIRNNFPKIRLTIKSIPANNTISGVIVARTLIDFKKEKRANLSSITATATNENKNRNKRLKRLFVRITATQFTDT